MFLKNRFLQALTILFIVHSIIGGLGLPLSPNIESTSYEKKDSLIIFSLYTPKIKEKSQLYILLNLPKEKKIAKPITINQTNDSIKAVFINPEFYKGVNKGMSFDLIAQNPKDGQMFYFSAFSADTSYNQQTWITEDKSILKDSKDFKWSFPNRNILRESIRNLFFHVPMWFAMMFMLIYSAFFSVKYLSSGQIIHDEKAHNAVKVGMFFGTMGILTGMIWAKHTWGAYWTDDPKLNGAAIGMLSYSAYLILRNGIEDEIKKAKIAAVYNIFAFTIYIIFIYILPRINASLHPGNGGNPGFNIYEQDNTMRVFFYPAVIGWIMASLWLKDTLLWITLNKKESLNH
jgi:heme exporter protein C